ncbi:hypothetical protein Acav_1891 [Paracidovorax avenae ATCC 19860]|uniref:Uncharacterized protein n=1 Tax=Paracidovorax avenae (strain ATCC 19860 / DSM 7227 / CCUG 15838 / JCM 20985 / LMG 2117 / NCPPB 1011) TaxID=643561 RepID=F0Q809_PARA1|nr:hypothetical protein [Paracidovorax avenae]ADX45807.1 hypothetical protein Acav_1891 [Paracidovorax avenae ATCC 19860]AVS67964.1 hypothetical protein C8245_21875 [Paracidovorax avenae]
MPNITLFIPAAAMPSGEAVAELSDRCALLCTGLLQSALANVHVACVAVHPGCGHPVFADVRYRLEPFRTPAVMEAFMQGLEEAILQTLRLVPRIRCFGYAASNLHARN